MLLRELEALDADGRITAEGKSLRALPLPPRLARMIVDAGREGHAAEAAQIAAVLSERGLGGDSVDLDARLDQFRPRPFAARRAPRGSRRSAGCASSAVVGSQDRRSSPPACCSRWRFRIASRAIAATARSCLRMDAAHRSSRRRRWRARHSWPSAS